ncbi:MULTISPECIES: hypothetical protein [Burkholderia]|uniref:Uncharacterized protein n=1 Tax=Burkholderia cenocepacia TaxID=95486 RepID=A0A071MHK1_9BURK|nr:MULTISPECIES: hypothetical protein [Burkholderia]AOJ26863.1 hypothetical protein WJ12_18315 [Burkholderia seminalis]KVF48162.1 hypothetical protein WJ13_00220 [Burkholderia seminalis]MBJ9589307.1 hypothetical protein [Burkholderia seminalis]MBN3739971.1 hypothetical protein [Burkholderia sp. Tr-20355]MCA8043679.1 hypothetical protein [Burkholderia seminalis]
MRARHFALLAGLACMSAAHGSAPAARPATSAAPNPPRWITGLVDPASHTSNPWRGSIAKPAVASGVAVPSAGNYAPLPVERQMRALSSDALGMPTVHRARSARRVPIRTPAGAGGTAGDWPGIVPPWSRSPW